MTLTIGTTARYERGMTLTRAWATLIPPLATDMLHRRNKRPNERRRWQLEWSAETATEVTALLSEYNTARGQAGTLSFVPPGESYTIPARFAEPIKLESFSPTRFRVSCVIVEDVRR